MIDLEIIEECRKGNHQNFREVVRMVSPFAFSVAFRMLGDEETAKDIVQESLVTLWEKINRIKSADSFKKWVYKIVVNKCYDQMRKRKREPEFRPDEPTWMVISNLMSHEPASELENSETARVISLLTEKLSPRQKAVFVLSDLEEMTSDEISAITGMSKRNVKANLYYARKNISGMINKYI